MNEISYIENVLAIKGIEMKPLTDFIIEIGDIGRFDNLRKIQKLASFAILKNESCKHKGESHRRYSDRKPLQHILHEVTVSVVAHNSEFKVTIQRGNRICRKRCNH